MESDFSAWLREQRGSRSKSEVERQTGVHRATILRAERGDALMEVASLRRLAHYYRASFDYGLVLMNSARTQRDRKNGIHQEAA